MAFVGERWTECVLVGLFLGSHQGGEMVHVVWYFAEGGEGQREREFECWIRTLL